MYLTSLYLHHNNFKNITYEANITISIIDKYLINA